MSPLAAALTHPASLLLMRSPCLRIPTPPRERHRANSPRLVNPGSKCWLACRARAPAARIGFHLAARRHASSHGSRPPEGASTPARLPGTASAAGQCVTIVARRTCWINSRRTWPSRHRQFASLRPLPGRQWLRQALHPHAAGELAVGRTVETLKELRRVSLGSAKPKTTPARLDATGSSARLNTARDRFSLSPRQLKLQSGALKSRAGYGRAR